MTLNKVALASTITGILIRLWLFNSKTLTSWLENRLEIGTPLNSWNRILEGIYLKNTIGAYEGDLVHELPMMLYFYEVLVNTQLDMRYFFVLFDLLNAFLVYSTVKKSIQLFHQAEKANIKSSKYVRFINSVDASESQKFLLNSISLNADYWSLISLGAYLFNPFCIASCVAQSTVTIQNCLLLLWFRCLLSEQSLIAFFFLAIHANSTVYSFTFFVASTFFLYQQQKKQVSLSKFMVKNVALFVTLVLSIFTFNLWLENYKTRFIKCTYLFILQVPDLVPNLGVFWYFFTEMFDHFRLFFTYVFQFNVILYAVPISLRLRDEPIMSILIQIGLISTLKSYPNIGETGMFLSLLPLCAYLFPLLRNFLIYSCMLLASIILAPIMFYLWVGSGGGNANFYFAITLVYSIGLIFLIVDVFYALLRREFIKLNGAQIPISKNTLQPAQFHLE